MNQSEKDLIIVRIMMKHDIKVHGFYRTIKAAFKCGMTKSEIKNILKGGN